MTSEQRLDRLERIAKLFAKAGLRARSETRRQYEILMDAQMRNEARFAQLAEAQVHTDRRLDVLIDIIREGRQGNSSPSA
ncbi:MAG TPA: hypothetical protein VGW36_01565 [Pyrinomonadaceae bacterium]|nr:hypothetical protein [Pyrinomonadaceae bacterium]